MLEVIGTPTDLNLDPAGGLNFRNNIIAGPSSNAIAYAASATAPTGATVASITAWVNTTAYANTLLPNNTDVGLGAPFNYVSPDFNPSTSAVPAATGASLDMHRLSANHYQPLAAGCCVCHELFSDGEPPPA